MMNRYYVYTALFLGLSIVCVVYLGMDSNGNGDWKNPSTENLKKDEVHRSKSGNHKPVRKKTVIQVQNDKRKENVAESKDKTGHSGSNQDTDGRSQKSRENKYYQFLLSKGLSPELSKRMIRDLSEKKLAEIYQRLQPEKRKETKGISPEREKYYKYFVKQGLEIDYVKKRLKDWTLDQLKKLKVSFEERNRRRKMSESELSREREELERRTNPDRYRWKRDPEQAFYEIAKGNEKWSPALQFIENHLPKRLPELRQRVLDFLPKKDWGSERHIYILLVFRRHKISLTEKETALMIKRDWIDPKNRVKKMLKDKKGDYILSVIGDFGQEKYVDRALHELKLRFPHRIPQLREALNQMREKDKWTRSHLRVLVTLLAHGEQLTTRELEKLRGDTRIYVPKGKRLEELVRYNRQRMDKFKPTNKIRVLFRKGPDGKEKMIIIHPK